MADRRWPWVAAPELPKPVAAVWRPGMPGHQLELVAALAERQQVEVLEVGRVDAFDIVAVLGAVVELDVALSEFAEVARAGAVVGAASLVV